MPAEDRYAAPLAFEPGRLYRQADEPIRVGALLWVLTDPHRGHEFAYNRWYERDHYYAGCMIGASTVAGSRWVATRRHKDARLPDKPALGFTRDQASYGCVYYILDGEYDNWLDWATPQVHALYAADRGFGPRTHYNTGAYRHIWRAYRDPDPVPVELALDRRYAGMVALWVERAPGVGAEQLEAWFEDYLPGWLASSPIASVSSWDTVQLDETKPDFVPGPQAADERRSLHLHFVESDPLDCWDRYTAFAEALTASGLATVALAAPFIPTIVGTDAYIDELW
ncbi:hypothetical protein GCM10023205_35390 [Yinghuangia aomiensis]|uniref:Uncharacterized protein n=1 Tax=Yinghuangia aomiensis TaxID=676205 RepID=A0ABP9HCG6_9ACTN